jgi:hypothetical protein
MRYFFHLVNASEIIRDEEGLELPDPEEARAAALSEIEELRREDSVTVEEWRGWQLNVVDDSGASVFSIALNSTSVGLLTVACLEFFALSQPLQHFTNVLSNEVASVVTLLI